MIGVRAGVCLALVGFTWLIPLDAGYAASEPVTTPQELTQALRSEAGGGSVRTVNLPDDTAAARTGDDKTILMPAYRLHADLGAAPTYTAIYLPGASANTRIAVNGHTVADHIHDPLPSRPRGANRIVLVAIANEFLRPGINEIDVVLAAPRRTSLSRVWIGDEHQLRDMYERKIFLSVTGPIISAAVITALSLCVLVLWARSPLQTLYGYFGIGGLLWALHTLWTVLPGPILSQPHQSIWWTMGYSFFVTPLVIFLFRLACWHLPRFERVLWIGMAAGPVLLYGAHAAGHLDDALMYWRLSLLGAVTAGVTAMGRFAMQQRSTQGILLLATVGLALAFGVHDWIVDQDLSDNNPVFLTNFSGLLFFPLVAWILVEAMRSAKDAAESANRAKSKFLAAASHDLRQPAHALGLYLAALQGEPMSPGQGAVIARMAAAVTALDTMFNALLDISRMDARVLEVNVHAFPLRPMLHRIAEGFAREAGEKNLRLSVRLSAALSARNALSDPLLLERIVRNLLDNAVKHTQAGGVLLSCRLRGGPAGHWRIEVWDTGPGIPVADQERVFEEFFQLGNLERNRAAGLGLGLSIVRRLSSMLNHSLRLVSTVGRGTRFVLDVQATDEATRAVSSDLQIRTLKLLGVGVVDDDPEVRTAMRVLLERWGCVVTTGSSAEELLACAGERPGRRLQVLIVDYQLANGRNGVDAIGELRRACGANQPALLVSGASAPERLAELKARGFDWLIKPVPAARLWHWLSQASSSVSPAPVP
ncbi:MAG: hybrid sensor histidine kinase/response regulator, partial [Caldimonas sp.]